MTVRAGGSRPCRRKAQLRSHCVYLCSKHGALGARPRLHPWLQRKRKCVSSESSQGGGRGALPRCTPAAMARCWESSLSASSWAPCMACRTPSRCPTARTPVPLRTAPARGTFPRRAHIRSPHQASERARGSHCLQEKLQPVLRDRQDLRVCPSASPAPPSSNCSSSPYTGLFFPTSGPWHLLPHLEAPPTSCLSVTSVLPTPKVPASASLPRSLGFPSSTPWSQSAMTMNFQAQENGGQLRWRPRGGRNWQSMRGVGTLTQ